MLIMCVLWVVSIGTHCCVITLVGIRVPVKVVGRVGQQLHTVGLTDNHFYWLPIREVQAREQESVCDLQEEQKRTEAFQLPALVDIESDYF